MRPAIAHKILRVGAGLALLVWLMAWVEWRQLAIAVRRCDPWWALIGLTLITLSTVPAALRVRALLHPFDRSFGWALRMTLSSYFFNQLLPTGLGGDAYRSVRLKSSSGGWISSVGLLTFERAVSAMTLLTPAAVYAFFQESARAPLRLRGHAGLPQSVAYLLASITIAIVVGAIILLSSKSQQVTRIRHELLSALHHISLPNSLAVAALSLLFHAFRLFGLLAFLKAVGYAMSSGDVLVAMALTQIASLAPVSLGALGVREGVFVYSFGSYGVPHAEALTVALLCRLAVVLLGASGGLLFYDEYRNVRSSIDEIEGRG